MSLIKLPQLNAGAIPEKVSYELTPQAAKKWSAGIKAQDDDDDNGNVINIYDVIGGYDDGAANCDYVAKALKRIGNNDVVVNINSPGGSYFEGVGIYNQLSMHPGRVTVQVVGMAASAASVIAMAGDEILIGSGAFLMIHNAWCLAMGNRHDLQGIIDGLGAFDKAMADLYAQRSHRPLDEIAAMMDKETWLDCTAAMECGLATGRLEVKKQTTVDSESKQARALVDTALAQLGMSRKERRQVLSSLNKNHSMPCAAEDSATPGAGSDDFLASANGLLNFLNRKD
ncbi:head maturation protease, ClpP-related [Snodgrassella alvi]|uniref:ATP-dependent Clp protease proteolytic subunit n=1 Tax=Snodgrassella alvi TaxID=1196083 RepID=A0A2N9WSQ2_9NEIS|nr:head maturation protease, ClpP-related [Snodgrassella alvi]PIT14013.1 hypothetical protein BGI32_08265 [Snodgrassella alvi]PIT17857.1 hypothetical protein BGI33_02310 [Snodgrassella alvi]PIT21771.1 hypothetical protein BGI34_00760 [Snodgrassella alvi]